MITTLQTSRSMNWRCLFLTFVVALLAVLLHPPLAVAQHRADAAAPAAGGVIELHVEGIISPATSDFIVRGLDDAAEQGAQLVVITLDTPGGLDTSMRSIVKHILASPVPVATWVGPDGARAASAGTFILYASHVAAMAPASNLGAATPVQIGAPSGSPSPADPKGHQQSGDSAGDPAQDSGDAVGQAGKGEPTKKANQGDIMGRKAANDAAAYLRSLAELRNRDPDFAQRAVLNAASMSAREALQANVIDIIATSVPDLLKQIDGRDISLGSGKTVQLQTAGAAVKQVTPDWRSQILGFIANPQVALILMMVGIYGLFYELTSPGLAAPGLAGLICLLLGLYAFQLLPVNWAGVALIFLGLSLMIAEAFMPSFGVIGTSGVVAFVLGGLFLTDTGVPGFDLSIPFLMGLAIVSAALLIAIAAMAARSHRRKVVTGQEQLIGMQARVTSSRDGLTYAQIHGESWKVDSTATLSVGDLVQVVAIDGLTLRVEPSNSAVKR